MKIRPSHLVLLTVVLGAVTSGSALMWTSQSVQTAEDRQDQIKKDILTEQQTIRVLRAEWDYLNRPDRIENLAREHLNMAAPEAAQMVPAGGTAGGTAAPAAEGVTGDVP